MSKGKKIVRSTDAGKTDYDSRVSRTAVWIADQLGESREDSGFLEDIIDRAPIEWLRIDDYAHALRLLAYASNAARTYPFSRTGGVSDFDIDFEGGHEENLTSQMRRTARYLLVTEALVVLESVGLKLELVESEDEEGVIRLLYLYFENFQEAWKRLCGPKTKRPRP